MIRLVVRRLALGVLTLLLVSVVVFAATQVLPGNAATSILGKQATPERVAALEAQLGLDAPVWKQYWTWISGFVQGDLGTSLASGRSVSEMLGGRIANSLFIMVLAAVVAVPIALALGVWAAIRRDRLVDHAISTTMLALAAVPEFVVGIVLVLLFATSALSLLPAVSILPPGERAWSDIAVAVLPAATLALAITPYIARITRASMVEALESDYVQMARLKGMSNRTVTMRHALPNALVPSIQVTALQLAWMAGGVVVVEYVFSYPGIGSALVDAVANRDIPVVQAITLLAGACYVLFNLIADVISIALTPKVRTALR